MGQNLDEFAGLDQQAWCRDKSKAFQDRLSLFCLHVPHRAVQHVISSAPRLCDSPQQYPGTRDQKSDVENADSNTAHPHLQPCFTLPHATYHTAALAFIDISGFTKVSTVLDVESLSNTINSYFDLIVQEILRAQGQVGNFVGDAVFAEWPTDDGIHRGPEDCIQSAAECCSRIIELCSNYPVYASGAARSSTPMGKSSSTKPLMARRSSHVCEAAAVLDVHCGISVGRVGALHVGDDAVKREFLLLGNVVDEATSAAALAGNGELVASPSALTLLASSCDLSASSTSSVSEPVTIARRAGRLFTPRQDTPALAAAEAETVDLSTSVREQLAELCSGHSTATLERLCFQVGLYVHPTIRSMGNEIARGTTMGMEIARRRSVGDLTAGQRSRWHAELRTVYSIFIGPQIELKETSGGDRERELRRWGRGWKERAVARESRDDRQTAEVKLRFERES